MTDQSPTQVFHASSFLQGHNADYIEQLHARYADNPGAVDASWQAFFNALGDTPAEARAEATGPSWARADWPPQPKDDLTNALDGQWPAEPKPAGAKIAAKAAEKGVELSEAQVRLAVLDSLRALMIIRAYRIRGHLIADLDPLGMRDIKPHPELDPVSYEIGRASCRERVCT